MTVQQALALLCPPRAPELFVTIPHDQAVALAELLERLANISKIAPSRR